jgi:sugar phosphate isomerase/epimerase
MESEKASQLGYYYVESPTESIHSLSFAERNQYIIAATSRGLRVYITQNFSCIHFIGKF